MSQTLVLLHGWGLNSAIWDMIKPDLEANFQVEALNMPGFGGEPWSDEFSDINKMADKIAADIRNHHQSPVILAGWSLGGLVATVIALRHPQLVERLHTIASSPCFVASPESDWPGIAPQVLDNFSVQLAADFNATIKRFLAVQAMGSPHAKSDIKTLQATLLSRPIAEPQALAVGLQWLATVDLRAQLGDLKVPLHRSYGRLDSLVPVAVTEQIKTGTSVVFQKSAHAPFLNQADDFCAWLLPPHPASDN